MRQQLVEAALTCRSITFSHAQAQFDYIQRLAISVGTNAGRLVRVEVNGSDVVVTYTATSGPNAA
jgi:hypothetical protein